MSTRIRRLRIKMLKISFFAEHVAGKSITDVDEKSRAYASQ